jgi:hypothetical protein
MSQSVTCDVCKTAFYPAARMARFKIRARDAWGWQKTRCDVCLLCLEVIGKKVREKIADEMAVRAARAAEEGGEDASGA